MFHDEKKLQEAIIVCFMKKIAETMCILMKMTQNNVLMIKIALANYSSCSFPVYSVFLFFGIDGQMFTSLLPPGKNVSGRYFLGLLFSFFFYVAGALSLQLLDGSQPNFHTRWRGGLHLCSPCCFRLCSHTCDCDRKCSHTYTTLKCPAMTGMGRDWHTNQLAITCDK